MTILPFGKRILVKPHEQQTILKDDASLSEYGTVVAIGDQVGLHWFWLFKLLGVKRKDAIKVNDRVGFSVFGIEKLVIGEEKHYLIKEDDDFLLAKITD